MALYIGDGGGVAASDDSIDGSGANDHINGLDGADTLNGLDDTDFIMGGAGDDEVHGGLFGDLIDGDGRIKLKTGNDTYSYSLFSGRDLLFGDEGDDTIAGGLGGDTIDGGDDDDLLFPDNGILEYRDESGYFGPAPNYLPENAGLYGDADSDTDVGDPLTGDDEVFGGTGNDTIDSRYGADTLDGGDDIDLLRFNRSASSAVYRIDLTSTAYEVQADGSEIRNFEQLDVTGGSGADRFIGGGLNDTLRGGSGNDQLTGGNGDDSLNGGGGQDWAIYQGAGAAVSVSLDVGGGYQDTGGAGMDALSLIENLMGSDFDDRLTGDFRTNFLVGAGGDDTLIGGDGKDWLNGGEGDDSLNGGMGADNASYADAAGAVTVDLKILGPQNTGGAGSDTLVSIENLIGSIYADALTGDEYYNVLKGGDGADTLEGGSGSDTLFGGGGVDLFVFTGLGVGTIDRDHIADLEAGEVIDISAVDADIVTGGDQAFTLASRFTGQAGELVLRYNATTDRTRVLGDVDGDESADFVIVMQGDFRGYADFDL